MRWQHCTSQSISSLATDSCRGYANCRDALRGAGLPSKRITLYEVRNVQISRISGVTAWPNVNTLRFQITKCQKLKMPQCQISTPMLQMPKSQNAKCQYLRINDPNAKISECQKNVKTCINIEHAYSQKHRHTLCRKICTTYRAIITCIINMKC